MTGIVFHLQSYDTQLFWWELYIGYSRVFFHHFTQNFWDAYCTQVHTIFTWEFTTYPLHKEYDILDFFDAMKVLCYRFAL